MQRVFFTLVFLLLSAASHAAFTPSLAPFPVEANGRPLLFNQNFVTLMPGESLTINSSAKKLKATLDDKPLTIKEGRLKWQAPEKSGSHFLELRGANNTLLSLRIFVLVPASQIDNDRINGYRIGGYPPPLNGLQQYRAPRGYIELTEDNANTKLSPHFTLGQFQCKQAGDFPKYLVVRPLMVDKLELLLADVNAAGYAASSFVIMSGYRTPWYNRAIGNVANSRHIYGGASDIYIDEDGDGVMDDLNKDGKVNLADARILYTLADQFVKRHERRDLAGGVGLYKANSAHGPFVHVDVRGSRARWGN